MKKITKVLMLFLLTCSVSLSAEVAAKKMKPMELTQEQRMNMATAHENMAVCLRSDKAIEICREEMMKVCESKMGGDGCPHMMKKMRGMKKGPMK